MSLPSLPRSTRWTNRGKNGVGENQGLQWNPGLPHAVGETWGKFLYSVCLVLLFVNWTIRTPTSLVTVRSK